MKKTEHLEKMVGDSEADAARKDVALNIVEACKPLENGGAASVESVSRHLLSITPLLLQMYLRDDPVVVAKREIAGHIAQCPAMQPDNSKTLKGVGLSMLGKVPAPVAATIIAIVYREEVRMVIRTVLGIEG